MTAVDRSAGTSALPVRSGSSHTPASLTPRASKSLRDAWLELFLLSGHLVAGEVPVQQIRPVRTRAEALLRETRDRLLAEGVPESWVDAAQLPVVGLVDEAARRSPAPGLAERWPSLQFPLYGHEEVGRTVFERLQSLRANQDTPVEVLEHYLRCLALGFEGAYSGERGDDLRILQEGLALQIRRALGTPTPVSAQLEQAGRIEPPRPMLRPLWAGVAAVVVLAVIGVGLSIRLSMAVESAEEVLTRRVGANRTTIAGRP